MPIARRHHHLLRWSRRCLLPPPTQTEKRGIRLVTRISHQSPPPGLRAYSHRCVEPFVREALFFAYNPRQRQQREAGSKAKSAKPVKLTRRSTHE